MGEEKRIDEPGHAALAIGEFYRATGETELDGHDLIDLAARCITAQVPLRIRSLKTESLMRHWDFAFIRTGKRS